MRKLLFLLIFLLILGCLNLSKEEIKVKEENKSIKNNKTKFNPITINNSTQNNSENNTKEELKNISEEKIIYSTINLDPEELFLELPYSETMTYNNEIIKKYKNITFVISKEPIDLSNAYLFNKVEVKEERDKLGNYKIYKFIPLDRNISISYCFYQRVGLYYIILQTYNIEEGKEYWDKWRSYILKKVSSFDH
ncbi:conserved hypothetical protein [Methanocaldococcus infernus ME]|uniref:Lipoprotein n=1 Tax=Methanocaldococcus infernus (strain DSM 11812 / JCM 15783 / ME) TaxID=573063 RepID=D5VRK1_METIM|nr:hypothetical protein [Methanocaldococcus infernus]ADG13204.1 conserved hypothetical protein [Methanocaldococcus infernus ME]